MTTLKPGTRVQLHPGTDTWMQGDRFGVIVRALRRQSRNRVVEAGTNYVVTLDKSGRDVRLHSTLIYEVIE